jgi:hypothetical protein
MPTVDFRFVASLAPAIGRFRQWHRSVPDGRFSRLPQGLPIGSRPPISSFTAAAPARSAVGVTLGPRSLGRRLAAAGRVFPVEGADADFGRLAEDQQPADDVELGHGAPPAWSRPPGATQWMCLNRLSRNCLVVGCQAVVFWCQPYVNKPTECAHSRRGRGHRGAPADSLKSALARRRRQTKETKLWRAPARRRRKAFHITAPLLPCLPLP